MRLVRPLPRGPGKARAGKDKEHRDQGPGEQDGSLVEVVDECEQEQTDQPLGPRRSCARR